MSRKHLRFAVEGKCELAFVTETLKPYLLRHNIDSIATCVSSCDDSGNEKLGGFPKEDAYINIKEGINRFLIQYPELCVTTMFDLYALPCDFPGYKEAMWKKDKYDMVNYLENALALDINSPRFIPYIQLHELEALILADPHSLSSHYREAAHLSAINELAEMVAGGNPELVNDGPDTCPSKRIMSMIKGFRRKAPAWQVIAKKIRIEVIREKCRHFDEWLTVLESLGR
ncbi:MAG: DUF4276 family protein [Nitrospirae bacterium]|nr:DUF4276 family protein [Nitrospirota bacterium]